MIDAEILARNIAKKGFGPFVGVPCSILNSLIQYIQDDSSLRYYAATSEGEAMGLAAGFALSGAMPVVLMQNSGLGNAINPITSLHLIYKIPALLLISLRGEIGTADAPEHEIIGQITDKFLNVLGIRYDYLGESEATIITQLSRAYEDISRENNPFAFIVKKDVIKDLELKRPPKSTGMFFRKDAMRAILSGLGGNEVIVSTTGFISRELYGENRFSKGNFYMLGSMGHAPSIALGIALSNKEQKVVVLDGDGALLMKMGTMVTIGHYSPVNLIHILFDNECYESTGGQTCVSPTANFYKVAKDVGYRTSVLVDSSDVLLDSVRKTLKSEGPHFIHIKLIKSESEAAGRVALEPEKIKTNVMEFIRKDE